MRWRRFKRVPSVRQRCFSKRAVCANGPSRPIAAGAPIVSFSPVATTSEGMSALLMGSLAEKQRRRACPSLIEQYWRSPSTTGPTTVTHLPDRGRGLVQAGGKPRGEDRPIQCMARRRLQASPAACPAGLRDTTWWEARASTRRSVTPPGAREGHPGERLRHSCVVHGPRRPQDHVGSRMSVCRPSSSTRLDTKQRPLYALPV